MASGKKADTTLNQKVNGLVAWYLQDKGVELRFVPNPKKIGRIAAEYDFHYYVDGRRITERALAMRIVSDMKDKGYGFLISTVLCAMTEQAWRYYVATVEYPEWMIEPESRVRRPRGRPRKHPPRIDLGALDAPPQPVNTPSEDEDSDGI